MTIRGGERTAQVVEASPIGVGFNSESRPPGGDIDWQFIDWPWTNEPGIQEWRHHRRTVERFEPDIAVAPDISTGLWEDPENVISRADVLDESAGTVVVVPKNERMRPGEVPDRFRVGVPLKLGIENTPYSPGEYRNAGPLHFLGGGPATQMRQRTDLRNAVTADSSAVEVYAKKGSVWTGREAVHSSKIDFLDGMGFYGLLYVNLVTWAWTWDQSLEPGDVPFYLTGSPIPEVYELVARAMPDLDEIAAIVREYHPRARITEIEWGVAQIQISTMDTNDVVAVLGDTFDIEVEATRGGTIINVLGPRHLDPGEIERLA